MLFRPEDIRVAETGEAASLHGTVAAAFFLGDRTRLFVDVEFGHPSSSSIVGSLGTKYLVLRYYSNYGIQY